MREDPRVEIVLQQDSGFIIIPINAKPGDDLKTYVQYGHGLAPRCRRILWNGVVREFTVSYDVVKFGGE